MVGMVLAVFGPLKVALLLLLSLFDSLGLLMPLYLNCFVVEPL